MQVLKDYIFFKELFVKSSDELTIYASFNQNLQDIKISLDTNAHLKVLFVNSKLNLKIDLKENAQLEIYNVYISSEDALININVDLEGINATTNITNVYLSLNNAILDSNVYINHKALFTNSDFMTYAICKDNAKMVLNNNAHIINGMHNSVAMQRTKGLNLSKEAKIITQPNLYIDEYDVKASHAVAIGSINQEDLFYLMSRGLAKEESERLIVLGFISPIIANIEDENLKQDIYNQFINYL